MKLSQTSRTLLGMMLLLLSGCGAEEEIRPELFPAQGSLIINGKPAAGALLVLSPADGKPIDERGSRPRATVQDDGTFQVTTYQSGDGAPAGEYQVGVLWFENPDANEPWDRLGNQYANPEKTGIRVSIQAGENQWEPIKIDKARLSSRPLRQPKAKDYDQVD